MKITKIKLKKYGAEGADIIAATDEESHTAELSKAVPVALEKSMAKFESHLLRICSYPKAKDKAEDAALAENVKIISLRKNGDKIGISGSLTTLNGEKELILNAPDVESQDEYDSYLELLELFESASDEAINYIINSSCTKGRQFAVKFNKEAAASKEGKSEEEKIEEVVEPPPADVLEVESQPLPEETEIEGF